MAHHDTLLMDSVKRLVPSWVLDWNSVIALPHAMLGRLRQLPFMSQDRCGRRRTVI